ncbi:MAG: acetyl-CoA carboxylase carboxyltransferase subunit alpha [Candidatus Margulisiibacteriota bacterium]
MQNRFLLDFERPIASLYKKIDELKKLGKSGALDLESETAALEKRIESLRREIFSSLTPIQVVSVSRHQQRPTTLDYIGQIFEDFVELHGDRYFGDDRALVGGFAKLDGRPVMVLGQQKGNSTKENIFRNFGMAHPEGYRKALRLMKLAEKFNNPIICLIDTPGAYPGIGAEERGQAEAIARNLREMALLKVPMVCVITGEGGSGGALGIGMGNRVLMFEYSIYSVISPEGCAAILFKDASRAAEAAQNFKLTAKDLFELKVIDGIIKEPLGGAHNDLKTAADNLKEALILQLDELKSLSLEAVVKDRYKKFRNFGEFIE